MDFVLIEGSTPEQVEDNKFLWGVNFSARIERLRDMVGLESSNLMRVVAKAAEMTAPKLTGVKKSDAQTVERWLTKHVRWGALRCPNVDTVERLLGNWGHIQRSPRVWELMEAAVQRWGRDNLFDWPTKIGIIIGKTDSTSLTYVAEALYAHMWRKNQADPYGAGELKKVVAEILLTRQYVTNLRRQFPQLGHTSAASAAEALRMLNAPVDFL